MLFTFLTVVQGIIAAALVGIILMQRSEGGGLGMGGGGSPGGLMSARGAADFMTRTTAILAFLFVTLSVVLAVVAVATTGTREIEDAFQRDDAAPAAAPTDPLSGAGTADQAAPAPADPAAPAQQAPASSGPLSGAAQ
jgi:preprotein translocase subunit SecG